MIKTHKTTPFPIFEIPVQHGKLGFSLCPGKIILSDPSGRHDRNLDEDIQAIKQWGEPDKSIVAVVCLMEDLELETRRVTNLGETVEKAGLKWFHLPLAGNHPPFATSQDEHDPWAYPCAVLRLILAAGGAVLVHCRGGWEDPPHFALDYCWRKDFPPMPLMSSNRSGRFVQKPLNHLSDWIVSERGTAQAIYDTPTTLALHRIRQASLTRRTAKHLPDRKKNTREPSA